MRKVTEAGIIMCVVALLAIAIGYHALHIPHNSCREHVIFYSASQERVVRAARFENGWFEVLQDNQGRFRWDTDRNKPEVVVRLHACLLDEMRRCKSRGDGPPEGFFDELWPPWDDPERLIGSGETIFKRR